MNVPGIRKALEKLRDFPSYDRIEEAVVRVGLRACDTYEWQDHEHLPKGCQSCASAKRDIRIIADILREAGVEVSE